MLTHFPLKATFDLLQMRVASVLAPVIALSVLVATVASMPAPGRVTQRSAKHYAGELPPGYSVALFLQICQICGQFYGTQHSSSCVHDKSFHTFALCLSSVENR
ncbi:hypothetical protein BsWGS_18883 [Bradybaena similaris]